MENTFRCVSSTPFGKPVVPDEHSITATLSAIFCGWHSYVLTFVSGISGLLRNVVNDLHRLSSPSIRMILFSMEFSSAMLKILSTTDDETNMIFGCSSLHV